MQDDRRPGWGILATGGIAGAFVGALRDAGSTVAAVGSRDHGRARAFADEHGIPGAHGSVAALAADPAVDIVYVATPHPFHAEGARAALEAGKHVLVEKPFTLNEAEAREVLALAEQRGLIALEALWTRWLPHVLEIHAVIAAGDIGRPQVLIAEHAQSLPTDPHHRINAPELGGGALLDLGVYPVSFGLDLFGEPQEVLATAVFGATGVDRRVSGTLVHAGGAHTVFTAALDSPGGNRAEIVGSDGRIEIDGTFFAPTGYTVLDAQGNEVRRSRPSFHGHGMQFEALEMERLLRDGLLESPRMSSADTLAHMRTLDAIRDRIGLVYPQEAAG